MTDDKEKLDMETLVQLEIDVSVPEPRCVATYRRHSGATRREMISLGQAAELAARLADPGKQTPG